jgi:hypothetical protein
MSGIVNKVKAKLHHDKPQNDTKGDAQHPLTHAAEERVTEAPVIRTHHHQHHVQKEIPVVDRHLHQTVVDKVVVPETETRQLPTVEGETIIKTPHDSLKR